MDIFIGCYQTYKLTENSKIDYLFVFHSDNQVC